MKNNRLRDSPRKWGISNLAASPLFIHNNRRARTDGEGRVSDEDDSTSGMPDRPNDVKRTFCQSGDAGGTRGLKHRFHKCTDTRFSGGGHIDGFEPKHAVFYPLNRHPIDIDRLGLIG